MHLEAPTALLGGLSPAAFMRRHWQKKPLLVRQALPGLGSPIDRTSLFELAGRDGVASRLVVRDGGRWRLRHGPLPRRALPPVKRPGWTLLVQGLDLHVPAAHELLSRFRFVPEARLDDLMISYASDGGGVGPHLDSYDVFLIQVHGRRRWRIGRPGDDTLVPGVPLKLLQHFEPEHDWLLEPGDLLYLPPRWAHDGVADGECMTCSVGFRAPRTGELARELLLRVADAIDDDDPAFQALYRDPKQPAVDTPGRIPDALAAHAFGALRRMLNDPRRLAVALGEYLSEPKPDTWFDGGSRWAPGQALVLDARTRMVYDDAGLFVNGESYVVSGRDGRLLRRLADARRLGGAEAARLSPEATAQVQAWADDGWLHADRGAAAASTPGRRRGERADGR